MKKTKKKYVRKARALPGTIEWRSRKACVKKFEKEGRGRTFDIGCALKRRVAVKTQAV